MADVDKFAKEGVLRILVGNKCDLKNKNFNLDEIQYFCKNENIVFFEISVKNNIGISKMMQYISSFGTKSDKE